MRLYAAVAFLSAFLLFFMQPITGKALLPVYGGGPAVWTTCMLFFQTMLLAGYAYAHWVGGRWPVVHRILLVIGCLAMLINTHPARGISPNPTAEILGSLMVTIGLPFFLLSSTSPLLQRWWTGERPYRLYAVSNAGSLIALMAYPFLAEPLLPLSTLGIVFGAGYVLFLGASFVSSFSARPREAIVEASAGWRVTIFWIALSAFASMLLLAVTAQMCQEVSSTPFLWVAPLALYLLAFMIPFAGDRWYSRRWTGLGVALAVPAACAVASAGLTVRIWIHVTAYAVVLFLCTLACSGELARSKPEPARLTGFYFAIGLGGALGGAFVALIAPRLFTDFREFYVALAGCCLLTLVGWYRSGELKLRSGRTDWAVAPAVGLLFAFAAPLLAMSQVESDTVHAWRNFYGILRVTQRLDQVGTRRALTHGRITHGLQYIDAGKRVWPTSYYGWDSGIGRTLEYYPRVKSQSLRVGIVGLGVGTLAAYGRSGDQYRFYEINPDVRTIAEGHFSYLKDSAASIEIKMGDARLSMQQEEPQGYDVLAIDAFSSDSIPTHLLSVECGAVYRRHLKPEGALLIHISNHSLDLAPVVRGLAERYGWETAQIHSAGDDLRGTYAATWVILTTNRSLLAIDPIFTAITPWSAKDRRPIVWTDDHSSLWRLLK